MNYKSLLIGTILVLFAIDVYAASEWVYVYKTMDDSAIVVRKNGEAYQIRKRCRLFITLEV